MNILALLEVLNVFLSIQQFISHQKEIVEETNESIGIGKLAVVSRTCSVKSELKLNCAQ